jgi:UDPglucose--hexose-1-phosphate uridylyltransferase
MPELRVDPLSGRLVAVAPGRRTRPGAEAAELEPVTQEELDSCPFCEGREGQTPPEVLALSASERDPDTPGWSVRVVPNKYPAFERQEVVVHTPVHARSLAELPAVQLELVAEAWRLRAGAARDAGKLVFASLNEGRAAGASLLHSHSQLFWLDREPPVPHAERGETCRLCASLDMERREGTRVVVEQDGLVLLCPYAGRSPYECLIAPLEHDPDGFGPLLGTALSLAAEALRRLRDAEHQPPVNLWLHEAGHWHLELLPRVSAFASLELGAGHYVNTLAPEQAAAALRG